MRRLGIYLTYDARQVVDNYIGYILKELKACVDFLVVVVNQPELAKGAEILEGYADSIFYRENIGFDAGGFKDALCSLAGWDEVRKYDELVLVNDSFYGPFCSMQKIFDEMERRSADFWGLLKYGESEDDLRYFPEHIQTFFLVVRNRMLHSLEFEEYWEKMPYYETFDTVVTKHETRFTQYFYERGFSYESYADDAVNINKDKRLNYNQYGSLAFELIKKRKFPSLKKKAIGFDILRLQSQEEWRQAFDYIDKETPYDIDLIWENLIRTMNVADIYRSLHLQYIVGEAQYCECSDKAAIALFVSYENSHEYVSEYILPLIGSVKILIYARSEALLKKYREQGLDGRVYSRDTVTECFSDLVGYEYVGILHDCDFKSPDEPNYIAKSYFYNIWENLAKSKGYVNGIITLFDKNERLGCLLPPSPNFGKYFGTYGCGWAGKYDAVKKQLSEKETNCMLSADKPPINVSKNLWIRGSILKDAVRIGKDTELLPYLWTYLAQHEGYYSGVLQSEDYVEMNEVNQRQYLDHILYQFRNQYRTEINTYDDLRKCIFKGAAAVFCLKHRKVYVYGTGFMMEQYIHCIPQFEAYVVSDGRDKAERINGKEVIYLSEIEVSEGIGIIICMDEKKQSEVIPELEKRGISDYLCI